MGLRELIGVLAVAAVCALLFKAPPPPEPEQWGIRRRYWDPRAQRTLWLDDYSLLGSHLICNQYPRKPMEGPVRINRGLHRDGEEVVLEVEIRLSDGECDSPFPWTRAVELQSFLRNSSLFLGEEPIARSSCDIEVPEEAAFTPSMGPGYRKVHYRFLNLTEEERARLYRAVEAYPDPQTYKSPYDYRANTYAGKPLPTYR